MEVKSKIIKEIPLVEKVDAQLEVYLVDKKRDVVFWEDIINKKNKKISIKARAAENKFTIINKKY